MKPSYLIIGGAGFIGSHTVDVLCTRGETVTIYDKKPWKDALNVHHREKEVTYVCGDILDFETLRAHMRNHTHVLHLAAVVSVPATFEDPLGSHAINVDGTLNVFEAARQSRVSRVVYASSAAVYGHQETFPIEETAGLRPQSPYALHKMLNEEYGRFYASEFGVSILGLRYFNVFGLRQDPRSPYSGVISIFTDRAKKDEPITIFGDGSASRDFVHVYDVANANVLALASDATGICNVGTGTEITLSELVHTLAHIRGRELQVTHGAERIGDIQRSTAAIQRATSIMGYVPHVQFADGLSELMSV